MEPPSRACRAYGCANLIARPRVFCSRHWKMLRLEEQRQVFENLDTTSQYQTILRTKRKIRDREAYSVPAVE